VLTPARRRGVEILDDPNTDPAIRARSIADVTRSNQWLGGLRAAVIAIREACAGLPRTATLLDVGTGLADIPARVRADCPITTIGVDEASSLLAASRGRVDHVACANALALPFRDRSIDIVCCSQLLHHFEFADAERVLREMARVARHAVVVSDLRRSWIAAGGFWLVSFPLAFHRVTRHDGVVSVLRGFTADELSALITRATGVTPIVERRLGFRLTARWSPRAA
jgi:ubiquinone/menaquinone biosynthesis C-methylase UbiE